MARGERAVTAHWIASRDDGGAPTLYDENDPSRTQESWIGSTMWEVKREAAHRNGDHSFRRHPRCLSCTTDSSKTAGGESR